MQSEVTVKIKGEDSVFKKKFLEYDVIVIEERSSKLEELVKAALAEFQGIPEDIQITCKIEWLNIPLPPKEESA